MRLAAWVGWSEAFAHHRLAPGPQRLGVFGIEGIGPDAGAHRADRSFVDFRYLAILAVAATRSLGRRDEAGPDRRRSTLWNRLELERRLARRGELGIDLRHEIFK